MSEKIQDKIQKLLDKAAGTDNDSEAEAFNEAAQRLMIKYAIDQEQIDARRRKAGHSGESIVTVTMDLRGTYARQNVDLVGWATQSMNIVECYYSHQSNSHYIMTFVGYESDVEQMANLSTSLILQCHNAMNRWRKVHLDGSEERKVFLAETRMFRRGFALGVSRKIEATRTKVVSETPGTELVLASRTDRIKKHMADQGITVRPVKSKISVGSKGAREAGFAEGRDADIGQKRINSSSTGRELQ